MGSHVNRSIIVDSSCCARKVKHAGNRDKTSRAQPCSTYKFPPRLTVRQFKMQSDPTPPSSLNRPSSLGSPIRCQHSVIDSEEESSSDHNLAPSSTENVSHFRSLNSAISYTFLADIAGFAHNTEPQRFFSGCVDMCSRRGWTRMPVVHRVQSSSDGFYIR